MNDDYEPMNCLKYFTVKGLELCLLKKMLTEIQE